MKTYGWEERRGFGIFAESRGWRVAYHSYEESVNGISAAAEWGIHLDSDETFTLLSGKGYLAVKSREGALEICGLNPGELYIVEAGERHILVLKEGARVLITENRNMENSKKEPAQREELEQIRAFMKGEEL